MGRFFTRRLLIACAAIIALVVAGLIALARQGGASTQYATQLAAMGTVTQSVAISGTLASAAESDLDFNASGKVNAVNVSAGQSVAAGQVLATVDTTSMQATLTQAQASVNTMSGSTPA